MAADPLTLRGWDQDHVWHPFTPMLSYRMEDSPIIESAEGFHLIDVQGRRWLDGISSLWCNVHGHRVPEIDAAIRDQLDRVAHTTLLGLSSRPSIELARKLASLAPPGLTKVFYSDSGATAVEAALKIAWQYHRQKPLGPQSRTRFATLGNAYHGDTIGAVSLGHVPVFHEVYGPLLFSSIELPTPAGLRSPPGFYSRAAWLKHCFDEAERIIREQHTELAAVVVEPLVQGAAGILVHPRGYLRHLRRLTRQYDVPLIADEVAVGFGRTGTMFACEQEAVSPDILCLAKGLTGGYLPLAATLTTEPIYEAFLGEPHLGRTFFHGHTYTGNPLGCAAALASLERFQTANVLGNVRALSARLGERLSVLEGHPHVGEVRRAGIMAGIELVQDRETLAAFPTERRTGHLATLAARRRGVIVRPLGDVVVLMPAPAMPVELLDQLCDAVLESIDEATGSQ
ncbi:MAG: adenosylmethionine--8-amino-7-oxononanoate transaminase [Planctomyces sp.]|nr:adenosylmethionine--8-amino-7-oxononanoate transaminase [Planctomyces sp.]